ncbi:MAG: CheR family methyltransferase [Acidobacteriota bacterium]
MDGEKEDLDLILEELCKRYGIEFSLYREGTVLRRLARRLIATGSGTYGMYRAYLGAHPGEYDLLLKDLTIKVSRFFRNREMFDLLSETVLPGLIEARKAQGGGTIRIWCAGCASGEEVYSVAIALMECVEMLGEDTAAVRVSIFGTDVDADALDLARRGEYKMETLRETRPEIAGKYFSPVVLAKGATGFRVADRVRDLVHFCRHDVASEVHRSPPAGVFSGFDLILCRNVLIYFTRRLQDRAFANLTGSLNPGGYLVLGKAEAIPDELAPVLIQQDSLKVYRKSPPPTRSATHEERKR